MNACRSGLTVVSSVKNEHARLERTIVSIAEQDYADLEYIIVDGGSTDGTAELVDRHRSAVSIFVSQQDEGVYHGMMRGASHATREWIVFLNAGDTYCRPDVLSLVIEQTAPEVDILYGNHFFGEETRPRRSLPFETIWQRLESGNLDESWIIGFPCHQAVFVRTALIREMQYDTGYRYAAEQEFLFRAFAAKKRFARCDVPVCRYEAGGMSHNRQVGMLLEKRKILRKFHPSWAVDRFVAGRIMGVLKRRLKERVASR